MTTSTTATVTAIYKAIVGGLSPTSDDLTGYVTLVAGLGWTNDQVATYIENTPFVLNVVDPIIREYQAAFGRVPDQTGLNFWTGVAAPNGPAGAINNAFLTSLATTFANSAEFQSRYGTGFTASTVVKATDTALVTQLYTNVLGRLPDQAGLTYWLNAGATVNQVLTSFANSTEFVNLAASPIAAYQSLQAQGTAPTSGSLLNSSVFGTTYVLGAGANTLTGLANNAIIDLTTTGTGANVYSPALGANIINIKIGTGTGAGTTYSSETVKGFKTVNLTTISASVDTGHTITFVNDDNTTFNVTGSELTRIVLSSGSTTGDKVDASGATGGVNIVGSAQSDILIGGFGKDTFSTGAKAGILTGNGGADIFDVHSAQFGAGGQITTITDFVAKTDSIGLIKQGTTAFNTTVIASGAATVTSVSTAINAALSALADGSTNAQVDWIQYAGNTYVVESISGVHSGIATTDLVVKLVGLIDLSGSAVTTSGAAINGYSPSLLS